MTKSRMKQAVRGLAIFVLCAAFMLPPAVQAVAAGVRAVPTTSRLLLDGREFVCSAYNINGNNYFKLRDLLQAINMHVDYDPVTATIRIQTFRMYTPDGSESTARAVSATTAVPSTASLALDGRPQGWTAYNIGGNNFFKLRDVLKALDIYVHYDGVTDTVSIVTNRWYEEEQTATTVPTPPPAVITGGTELLSPMRITTKTLTSDNLSREDFSQQANPAVFDSTYTRGIYNLIRQIILDYDIILSGADESGVNPYYHYPHTASQDAYLTVQSVFNRITAYRRYRTFGEPYLTNTWQYPGYISATHVPPNQMIRDADAAAEGILAQAAAMTTAGKVRFFNDFVRSRIVYANTRTGTLLDVYAGTEKVPGVCSLYTYAFQYLCDKAGIPVMSVSGVAVTGIRHSWNLVYADGVWFTVDVTADIVLTNAYTFAVDENPRLTAFIKEVLVPGSTK